MKPKLRTAIIAHALLFPIIAAIIVALCIVAWIIS
jgi:hypothetical protein